MSHTKTRFRGPARYGASRTHELDLLVSYHTLAAAGGTLLRGGIDAQHLTFNALTAYDR